MTFQERLTETNGKRTTFRLSGGHVADGVPVQFGDDFIVLVQAGTTYGADNRGVVVREADIVCFEIERR